jgi:hypothetical protein
VGLAFEAAKVAPPVEIAVVHERASCRRSRESSDVQDLEADAAIDLARARVGCPVTGHNVGDTSHRSVSDVFGCT